MEDLYDLLIIGSGPAGLSAAVYAQRARLKTLIIEKNGVSGGQIINTCEVDNYPGLPAIGGFDLGMKMRDHVEQLDGEFYTGEVVDIKGQNKIWDLSMDNGTVLHTKAMIIACGASHAHLNIPGEAELSGAGVSYCATCDGAFFKDSTVAVIGGGEVAVTDAIFLANICKEVYVIHRRDSLRAVKVLSDKLLDLENVKVLWEHTAEAIEGAGMVERLRIRQVKTNEEKTLAVEGIFIAVGMSPNSGMFKDLVPMDEAGYIIADETGITETPGIFVAGDIRTKALRQVICAASDGANAVYSVQKYLAENF